MRRHLDTGEIHAWLDGELDAVLGEDAADARAHVERCDVCRARIEEESALRERASAVLAGAAPDAGPLPSLEELRERSRATPDGRRGASARMARWQRWAWAASVVLALGIGWGVRDRVRLGPGEAPVLRGEEDVRDRDARPGAGAGPAMDEVTPPVEGADPRAPATTGAGEAIRRPASPGLGPEAAGRRGAERTAAPREGEDLPPPPAGEQDYAADAPARALADASEEAAGPGVQPDAGTDRAAAEPAPTTLSQESATGARRETVPGAGAAALAGADAAPETLETGADPVVLTVPGLPVLSVVWTEPAEGVRVVRVLQRTEKSDTLELLVVPGREGDPAADAALSAVLAEPLPEEWSRVVRVREDFRFVVRASLPREELAGLVEGIGAR